MSHRLELSCSGDVPWRSYLQGDAGPLSLLCLVVVLALGMAQAFWNKQLSGSCHVPWHVCQQLQGDALQQSLLSFVVMLSEVIQLRDLQALDLLGCNSLAAVAMTLTS